MWNYIVNPESGRNVNINGQIGRKIIKNYLIQLGGDFPSSFSQDVQRASQKGGGNCSLCGSPNTTKRTCPLNQAAKNKNISKHPNAKKGKKTKKGKAWSTPTSTKAQSQKLIKVHLKIKLSSQINDDVHWEMYEGNRLNDGYSRVEKVHKRVVNHILKNIETIAKNLLWTNFDEGYKYVGASYSDNSLTIELIPPSDPGTISGKTEGLSFWELVKQDITWELEAMDDGYGGSAVAHLGAEAGESDVDTNDGKDPHGMLNDKDIYNYDIMWSLQKIEHP